MNISEKSKMIIKKIIMLMIPVIWSAILFGTNSLFSVYTICALLSIYAGFINKEVSNSRVNKAGNIVAVIISFLVSLANYKIELLGNRACAFITIFVLGILVFKPIFVLFCFLYEKQMFYVKMPQDDINEKYDWIWFAIPSAMVILVDVVVLRLAYYPGCMNPDSFTQLIQVMGDAPIQNHHPYWHSMLIKFFFTMGRKIGHTANFGVFTYSIFQIFLVAISFAYSVWTLKKAGLKKYILICIILGYIFIPYNIIYSFTMWKDVVFAAVCLIFVTSLFRIQWFEIEKPVLYLVFFVSSLGICIFRSNGKFAFFFVLVSLVIREWKNRRKVVLTAGLAFLIGIFMTGPLLKLLNVQPGFASEALSIPLQQIARVCNVDGKLSEEDSEFVEFIMGKDYAKNSYLEYISDPIKDVGRSDERNAYLQGHCGDFIRHWASIGMKNPLTYVEAWVEQTKGYWNGGYNCYVVWEEAGDLYDINPRIINEGFREGFTRLIDFMRYKDTVLSIVISMGFMTWIYIILFFMSIVYNENNICEITLALAIVLSLMVATPVCCEFRYGYGFVITLPFVLCAALVKKVGHENVTL